MITTYHVLFPVQRDVIHCNAASYFRDKPHSPFKGNPQVCLQFISYFGPFLFISSFFPTFTSENSDNYKPPSPHTHVRVDLHFTLHIYTVGQHTKREKLLEVSGLWDSVGSRL